ncbi:MAG TPA: patatin-like phospholipase family protein [Candidatus Paceibacterota bacterium]|nr:patatin-like phospholipase family protein [Candidatus Paceibacterota bacterium]
MHEKKVFAVFEGGGVKGTGLVGAVEITEQQGYEFSHVAGTSAGAIVASLVAAGYSSAEMKEIMMGLDYLKFKDEGFEDKIPLIGKPLSLLFTKGIYEGDYFEAWIRDLLAKKNIRTFGDLVIEEYEECPRYRYRLQVVASDVSRGKLLVLPWDALDYGIHPDELDVARAVRMSMSIPYFYKPIMLKDKQGHTSYMVDGGVLSNYPVWLFDPEGDNTTPLWPTFGYKLVEPEEGKPRTIKGPISMLTALFATMMEAHDARYIKDANFLRTIPIETLGIQTTQFDMTMEQKEALYESGKKAATEFFAHWSFEEYATKTLQTEHRTDKVWSHEKA